MTHGRRQLWLLFPGAKSQDSGGQDWSPWQNIRGLRSPRIMELWGTKFLWCWRYLHK